MALHWTVNFTCEDCGAQIVFEDEVPSWKEATADPEQVAAAHAFVDSKPVSPLVGNVVAPLYVHWGFFTGWYVLVPPTVRYVDCPVCATGRAVPVRAAHDAADDETVQSESA